MARDGPRTARAQTTTSASRRPALRHQGLGDVHERVRRTEGDGGGPPRGQARRGVVERIRQGSAPLEVAQGDRLAAEVLGQARTASLTSRSVSDAGEGAAPSSSSASPAGRAEDEEMAGEVAAVHRGDVPGLQRAEAVRPIPVVEVAAEPLESAHRGDRGLEAFDRLEGPDPAEVTRGDRRQQVSPMLVGDVRCATTGFGSSWKLSGGRKWSAGSTNVSKNRHVRRPVKRKSRVWSGDTNGIDRARTGRLIHRATIGRRTPEQDERRGNDPAFWPEHDDQRRCHRGQHDRAAHPSVESGQIEGQGRPRLCGRDPLERPASADVHAKRVCATAALISHAWWARSVTPGAI